MNSKDIQKNLSELEQELSDLQQRRDALQTERGPLDAQRSTAIEALTEGDKSQKSVIDLIDGEIKAISLRTEGIDKLINKKGGEVSQAQQTLKETIAQEQADEGAYVQAEEQRTLEQICKGMVQREKRIAELYGQLGEELTQLYLDELRTQNFHARGGFPPFMDWKERVSKKVAEMGYKSMNWTPAGPIGGTTPILALVKPDKDFAAHAGRANVVHFAELLEYQRGSDHKEWRNEFRKLRGLD